MFHAESVFSPPSGGTLSLSMQRWTHVQGPRFSRCGVRPIERGSASSAVPSSVSTRKYTSGPPTHSTLMSGEKGVI